MTGQVGQDLLAQFLELITDESGLRDSKRLEPRSPVARIPGQLLIAGHDPDELACLSHGIQHPPSIAG